MTTEENSLEKPRFSISDASIFELIAAQAKLDPASPQPAWDSPHQGFAKTHYP